MIFAVGAAAELTNPSFNTEGELYRHLARAALGLKCIFDHTSLSAIQTICLMGCYDVITARNGNFEEVWRMYLVYKLSLSVSMIFCDMETEDH